MARRPREDVPGAIHHVTARGNRQQLIYVDKRDREVYFLLLAQAVKRYGWLCLAYCLMDNHVHLLVETPDGGLGRGMQRLHGLYAESFNRRHKRSGHLFQGRYGAVRIESEAHMLATIRYIVLNPVEARLCVDPARWPWSSHAAMVSGAVPPWLAAERLLSYFAAWGGEPQARYLELIGARTTN